jgi:hypothetical protein
MKRRYLWVRVDMTLLGRSLTRTLPLLTAVLLVSLICIHLHGSLVFWLVQFAQWWWLFKYRPTTLVDCVKVTYRSYSGTNASTRATMDR